MKLVRYFMSMILLVNSFSVINAEENNANEGVVFQNIVEQSPYYQDYEDNIEGIYVQRSAETEFGIRYTINYELKTGDISADMLVFIGDSSNSIIDVLLVRETEESMIVYDLDDDYSVKVNSNPAKGQVYQCRKAQCTAYRSQVNINNDYGCSLFLGQSCNVASLFGYPIATILCKAGVWVACRVSVDKVCTNYSYYYDVCAL